MKLVNKVISETNSHSTREEIMPGWSEQAIGDYVRYESYM